MELINKDVLINGEELKVVSFDNGIVTLSNGKKYKLDLVITKNILKFKDEAFNNEVCNEIMKKTNINSRGINTSFTNPNYKPTHIIQISTGDVTNTVKLLKNVPYHIEEDALSSFRDEYRFLSNMYSQDNLIEYKGLKYSSVECAFQGQKDPSQSESFTTITNPVAAKRMGKRVDLRPDWELVKDSIMEELVYIKFSTNEDLKQKLLQTGNRQLVEGNTWHDKYWGVENGIGLNKLGKILMKVRDKIRNE